MTLQVITEDDQQTSAQWRLRLNLTEGEWDLLTESGIFSAVRGKQGQRMRLSFVGFAALKDRLLVCVPRFGIGRLDPVTWVRRVLSAYFAAERRRSRPDWARELTHRDETLFREFDALTTLMKLYADTGLYRRTRSSSTRQGLGSIDWQATLSRTEAIVMGNSVFYPEPFRRHAQALLNDVSLIQAVVTWYLTDKYRLPQDALLTDLTAGMDVCAFLAPRRMEAHIGALRRERTVTYRARDLQLLQTLEAVLANLRGLGGPVGMRLHGTSAFAHVWEDALRDLFGDDSEQAELGRPVWYDHDGTGWLPPHPAPAHEIDLLVGGQAELIILDAKYHFPFPDSRPGWADIVKQVYYAETIQRGAGEAVRNAFMLPMSGPRLRLAGRVEVLDGERTFPNVEAWHVDPLWVFSTYGDSDAVRRRQARDVLRTARSEMPKVPVHPDGDVGG